MTTSRKYAASRQKCRKAWDRPCRHTCPRRKRDRSVTEFPRPARSRNDACCPTFRASLAFYAVRALRESKSVWWLPGDQRQILRRNRRLDDQRDDTAAEKVSAGRDESSQQRGTRCSLWSSFWTARTVRDATWRFFEAQSALPPAPPSRVPH